MIIYNSLTNQEELFVPVNNKQIKMYVCGPTVYDFIHIGNARPVIFFDVVARYFRYCGYDVIYASNITDVDDKIIKKALNEKKTEEEIVGFFLKQYYSDCQALGSKKPDIVPMATKYIGSMIKFIESLVKKGYAYEINGDVYFRVDKVLDYGVLSNQNVSDLDAGSRISVDEKKENPLDFSLWKKTNQGIKWDSPWGEGRPGWHTECVVMIDDIFRGQIDIHGGGSDLKFPHHENEIAQSCANNGHHLAKYWLHVGRLEFGSDKMSKSLGNIIWVKDLLAQFPYQAFRLFMLASPYRQPMNYNIDIMKQFDAMWKKIERTYKLAWQNLNLLNLLNNDITSLDLFSAYMDDDFNTPNVITFIDDLVKRINVAIRGKYEISSLFNGLKVVLSILGISVNELVYDDQIKQLYHDWVTAKNNKDYTLADQTKIKLLDKGIIL